jgi:hypothetical protein
LQVFFLNKKIIFYIVFAKNIKWYILSKKYKIKNTWHKLFIKKVDKIIYFRKSSSDKKD